MLDTPIQPTCRLRESSLMALGYLPNMKPLPWFEEEGRLLSVAGLRVINQAVEDFFNPPQPIVIITFRTPLSDTSETKPQKKNKPITELVAKTADFLGSDAV